MARHRPAIHVPLLLAKRYFFARKRKSVINLISRISLVGLVIGTASLVVVLSVYNGIGELTQSLFNVFDPELLVEPAEGKTFRTDAPEVAALWQMEQVKTVAPIVEENAWITHKQNECIALLRGVDAQYAALTGIDTMLYEGAYVLHVPETYGPGGLRPAMECVVMGGQLYFDMGVGSYTNSPVAIHIPRRGVPLSMSLNEAFHIGYAYPAGCFFLQQDIDSRYVLADVDFVRGLLDYDSTEVTALALAVSNPRKLRQAESAVRAALGSAYKVRNRFQQQPLYYKVYRSERLGIVLILSLIVLIAMLTLVASLTLLILDKRRDVVVMKSLGMTTRDVQQVFLLEGMLICMVGVLAGLALGFVVCFVQQQFGLIKMGGNFITSAFPVRMRVVDFVGTLVLVGALSSAAVALTVRRARRYL